MSLRSMHTYCCQECKEQLQVGYLTTNGTRTTVCATPYVSIQARVFLLPL